MLALLRVNSKMILERQTTPTFAPTTACPMPRANPAKASAMMIAITQRYPNREVTMIALQKVLLRLSLQKLWFTNVFQGKDPRRNQSPTADAEISGCDVLYDLCFVHFSVSV